MNRDYELLNEYCQRHTTPQSAVLHELERETWLKTLAPQMMSGHLQGAFLNFLVQMHHPQTILEIGTFTGYAAICMASAMPEDGMLHTIEANEELEFIIRKYIEKAGLKEKIKLHIGDAKAIIPSLNLDYDLVFIDAGKKDNAAYYDLIFDRVKPGGLILADNVLWSGKVAKPNKDSDTSLIDAFNKKVQEDERIENMILPIRDGLLIVRKL